METRICAITIIITDRTQSKKVHNLLSEFGDKIIARLGVPYRERGINIISLILEANNDDMGALAGKLGQISGIKVKSLTV